MTLVLLTHKNILPPDPAVHSHGGNVGTGSRETFVTKEEKGDAGEAVPCDCMSCLSLAAVTSTGHLIWNLKYTECSLSSLFACDPLTVRLSDVKWGNISESQKIYQRAIADV